MVSQTLFRICAAILCPQFRNNSSHKPVSIPILFILFFFIDNILYSGSCLNRQFRLLFLFQFRYSVQNTFAEVIFLSRFAIDFNYLVSDCYLTFRTAPYGRYKQISVFDR